ncbi:hypothetical protein D3C76_1431560 [compost metagenome]
MVPAHALLLVELQLTQDQQPPKQVDVPIADVLIGDGRGLERCLGGGCTGRGHLPGKNGGRECKGTAGQSEKR